MKITCPHCSQNLDLDSDNLGIHDSGGNLWEWIENWDDGRKDRIMRGACFMEMDRKVLNSATKGKLQADDYRSPISGFRCVLEVPDLQTTKEPAAGPRVDGLVANGEWQDVLARLDQNRLLVKGDWTKTAAGMECLMPVFGGFITMETSPLDSFEARVKYTAPRHDRINVILPSPTSYFDFSMSPYRKTISVGQDVRPLKNRTGGDSPHELHFSVAPESLKVTLDGEVIYEVSPMDWGSDHKSGKYRLGLYLHQGNGIFHGFDIRIPKPANLNDLQNSPPSCQATNMIFHPWNHSSRPSRSPAHPNFPDPTAL